MPRTYQPFSVQRCRRCGAEIVWARTVAGKRMPLDAEPNEAGNVYVGPTSAEPRTLAHVNAELVDLCLADPEALGGQVFMPHFATCRKRSR